MCVVPSWWNHRLLAGSCSLLSHSFWIFNNDRSVTWLLMPPGWAKGGGRMEGQSSLPSENVFDQRCCGASHHMRKMLVLRVVSLLLRPWRPSAACVMERWIVSFPRWPRLDVWPRIPTWQYPFLVSIFHNKSSTDSCVRCQLTVR